MSQPVVIDASSLVEYLSRSPRGYRVQAVLNDVNFDPHAPDLLDVEALACLRRSELRGVLPREVATVASIALRGVPIRRHGCSALGAAAWTLRHNFTIGDAMYVVLARRLGASLLTDDERLARAVLVHAPDVAVV